MRNDSLVLRLGLGVVCGVLALICVSAIVRSLKNSVLARDPTETPGTYMAFLRRLDDQELRGEYLEFHERYYGFIPTGVSRDRVLAEIQTRGGSEWLAFMKKECERNHIVEPFTVLRRMQGLRDPLEIVASIVDDGPATVGRLPKIEVKLKNVDEEAAPVAIQFGGDYRSGREARWRFRVWDAKGRELSTIPGREGAMGGGLTDFGELKYGESWETVLPVDRYCEIAEAGQYTWEVLYHDKETIADFHDIQGLVMSKSKHFKITVGELPKNP